MQFHSGDKVVYNNEEYVVQWVYDTGYLEISKDRISNCILVHMTEIVLKKE
jgi:hypothetical protein